MRCDGMNVRALFNNIVRAYKFTGDLSDNIALGDTYVKNISKEAFSGEKEGYSLVSIETSVTNKEKWCLLRDSSPGSQDVPFFGVDPMCLSDYESCALTNCAKEASLQFYGDFPFFNEKWSHQRALIPRPFAYQANAIPS